jgi:hypothetical protein
MCKLLLVLFAMVSLSLYLSKRILDLEIELYNTTEGRQTNEETVIQDLKDQYVFLRHDAMPSSPRSLLGSTFWASNCNKQKSN